MTKARVMGDKSVDPRVRPNRQKSNGGPLLKRAF